MIIRTLAEYNNLDEVLLNLYPDQFVKEGKYSVEMKNDGKIYDSQGNILPMPRQHVSTLTKQSDTWAKINMDYFYTVGLAQYGYQRLKISRNYELMKGILTPEDFYAEGPVMSFVDQLIKDVDLPSYVQHYPILNPPINAMVGEKSKRPDVSRPKAMDDQSKSEELQYYTKLYQQMLMEQAKEKIKQELLSQGVDTSNLEEFQQQVEQMTAKKIQDDMTSYTSLAEKWACNVLSCLKVEFNLKELFEEGFRDMLIVNKQFYHIYEDKSKTGFKVDCLNPKYVWWLTTPDKKYIKDAYVAGIVEIMELSEILDKYDLPEEEIEHLREYAMQAFFPYSRQSNLYNKTSGIDSIQYNAYDPLVVQERNKIESAINGDNKQSFDSFLGNAAPSVGTFGNRFIVTTAYWKSKRRYGLVTYIDEKGDIQCDMVDDTYKEGTHPQEISVEWNWMNQWYKGVKIGDDIYHVAPLEILDYCPIIGVIHEIKNTMSVSLVDLMKPWQTIYNVCINQVYRLFEKEKGKVLLMSKRHVPLQRGTDYEDSMEIWERMAEETGVIWIDDSPDNLKVPSSFNQFTTIDWDLTLQIKSRMEMAEWAKNQCWELVGLSKQRLGSVTASETATGTNTALTQSYAQTEPYFVQQEYLENQVLQAILDVAQYVECKNPTSTISNIGSEGENIFCQIQTESDLKNRDIKLFMTSRSEDQRIFNNLQQLAQAALQNGTSLYEVAQLYTTTSVRQIMDTYKQLKEKQDALVQQNQELQQNQQQIEQQKMESDAQMLQKEHEDNIQIKLYEIDTQANTALTIERIKERIQIAKENQSTAEPDMLDILSHGLKQQDSIYNRDIASLKLQIDQNKMAQQKAKDQQDLQLKTRKLDLEERNIDSREQIEKAKLKQKPKTTKK